MTKAKFAKDFAQIGLGTKTAGMSAYDMFVNRIAGELSTTDRCQVTGLGTFKVKTTAARPMPGGKSGMTAPRKIVKFRAAPYLDTFVAIVAS